MSAQEGFGWVGLSSYVARGGSFDALSVLAPGTAEGSEEERAGDTFGRMGAVLSDAGVGSVRWIAPAVRAVTIVTVAAYRPPLAGSSGPVYHGRHEPGIDEHRGQDRQRDLRTERREDRGRLKRRVGRLS